MQTQWPAGLLLIEQNILLTKETPDCPRQIKIADFGLAKMGTSLVNIGPMRSHTDDVSVHSGTMLVSMVGTPQYLAPEVVMQTKQKVGYENKVDSWSVGIVVYRSVPGPTVLKA